MESAQDCSLEINELFRDHDEDVSSVLVLKYKTAIKILCVLRVSQRFFLFFFSPPVVFGFDFVYQFENNPQTCFYPF